jgi:hypothetical protein
MKTIIYIVGDLECVLSRMNTFHFFVAAYIFLGIVGNFARVALDFY